MGAIFSSASLLSAFSPDLIRRDIKEEIITALRELGCNPNTKTELFNGKVGTIAAHIEETIEMMQDPPTNYVEIRRLVKLAIQLHKGDFVKGEK